MFSKIDQIKSKNDFLAYVLKTGYDSILKYENSSEEFFNQVEHWIFDVILENDELFEIDECLEIIDKAVDKYYFLKKELNSVR